MPKSNRTPPPQETFRRETQLERLAELQPLDIAIIGGGATGVGAAVDAACRGFKVAIFERDDFGHGTSSRSTKLVHGGVRYLQQGNVSLVREALHERGLLLRNAPHLVYPLPTLVPIYQWWEGPYYALGMKTYDLLAGRLGIEPSQWLSRSSALERAPTLVTQDLRGGVCYYDAGFDDSRLLTNLMQAAIEHDAACLNHTPVREITRHAGHVTGLVAEDLETGATLCVDARVVVNAAGPFCDEVRQLDDPSAPRWIAASQGAHIVVDQRFLPGQSAVLVPRTRDGRVVFAIPWQGRVVIGTTDTPLDHAPREPRAMEGEVDFLLETIAGYLSPPPKRSDVLSAFAGVRPLVQADPGESTARLSRDHEIRVSESGLISVLGGKWTTYRRMAEDAVDRAIELADLPKRPCVTSDLDIHDHGDQPSDDAPPLHPALPYNVEHVDRAVRWELARTVEDVLSRRTRSLLLDARAAAEAAPGVAAILAKQLGRDEAWQAEQVKQFQQLASIHQV